MDLNVDVAGVWYIQLEYQIDMLSFKLWALVGLFEGGLEVPGVVPVVGELDEEESGISVIHNYVAGESNIKLVVALELFE